MMRAYVHLPAESICADYNSRRIVIGLTLAARSAWYAATDHVRSKTHAMPVSMEPMALTGARQTLDGVEQIRALWPEHPLTLLAVVPTGVNLGTHASRATLEALRSDARLSGSLRAGIRQCIDLTYAIAAGQSIWEYAAGSRAASDYATLIEAIDIRTN